jgi:hypothetical protein
MSNKFITTIAASFIALLPASAQQVETLPQQNLAKWHISPANYSGITRIDSSLYAVVDDKSSAEGFVLLSIDVDPQTGKIRQVTDKGTCHPARPDSLSFRADCEDLVYVPSSRTVFVAQEYTGQVKEYTMQGELTGRALRIPESMGRAKQQWNGFEALAYHQPSQTFWLTTENSLKADAPADSKSRQLLRLNAFSSSLDSLCQRLYMMEAPRLKQGVKYYTHGVPAMTALPDGRLLVMERELSVPRRYLGGKCLIRIFVVDPAEAVQPGAVLTKREVAQFSTHIRIGSINYANYEGMCLGPQLADGRQTLLLVNDSQAGAGNAICKLKDYLKTIILPHNF